MGLELRLGDRRRGRSYDPSRRRVDHHELHDVHHPSAADDHDHSAARPTTTTEPPTTTTTEPPTTTTTTPRFADVSAETTPYADEIDYLAGLGVISGTVDGLFHPYDPLLRQQFAKMIVLTLGYDVDGRRRVPLRRCVPPGRLTLSLSLRGGGLETGDNTGYEDRAVSRPTPI